MTPGKHGREPIQNLATVPHSGLCDAGKVTFGRRDDGLYEPIEEQCTCGAGLLRLMGGAR